MTGPTDEPNVLLDCPDDNAFPTNEPAIAVDPSDPRHTVAVAIDYSGSIEFYTSFDGGPTWTEGDLPRQGANRFDFDPAVSFDVDHGAIIASYGEQTLDCRRRVKTDPPATLEN